MNTKVLGLLDDIGDEYFPEFIREKLASIVPEDNIFIWKCCTENENLVVIGFRVNSFENNASNFSYCNLTFDGEGITANRYEKIYLKDVLSIDGESISFDDMQDKVTETKYQPTAEMEENLSDLIQNFPIYCKLGDVLNTLGVRKGVFLIPNDCGNCS